MIDRVPTEVLDNGAIRYGVYDSNGQLLRYEYIKPEDAPTQEGTPLNKANLFSDDLLSKYFDNPTGNESPRDAFANLFSKKETLLPATSALYGLGTDAVPDDVFDLLSNVIPSPYGMLSLKTVDSSGSPISTTLSISPNVDGSSIVSTGSDGFLRAYVQPGTYTISNDGNVFQTAEPASATITIKAGQVTKASFTIAKITSGEIDITTSGNLAIPKWMNDIDLFCVGGGGSGGAVIFIGTATRYACASGGGGGYTATQLNYNAAGKTLDIVIGAGGASTTTTTNASAANGTKNGKDGGVTSISVDGTVVLSAKGGKGGQYGYQTSSSNVAYACAIGGDGGSGGGGANYSGGGNGGSDGTGGYNAGNTTIRVSGGSVSDSSGGLGQKTTTRKFGEAAGTLYGGGGGGCGDGSTEVGSGGEGGGGDGNAYGSTTNTTVRTIKGGDGTTYGGGGGGAAMKTAAGSGTVISGAGHSGLVSIRWGA